MTVELCGIDCKGFPYLALENGGYTSFWCEEDLR